jgi:hypothetical protein
MGQCTRLARPVVPGALLISHDTSYFFTHEKEFVGRAANVTYIMSTLNTSFLLIHSTAVYFKSNNCTLPGITPSFVGLVKRAPSVSCV